MNEQEAKEALQLAFLSVAVVAAILMVSKNQVMGLINRAS